MPHFRQLFVALRARPPAGIELDRLAFCLRKRAEREAEVYFPSLSARTLVYKGMLTTGQLEPFFPDLSRRALRLRAGPGPLALLDEHLPVAGRWPHPYRLIAHNGEINTVKGNRNWMQRPREPADAPTSSPATSSGSSRSAPPAPPTRRPSTRCSSCSTSAAGRCRTRC